MFAVTLRRRLRKSLGVSLNLPGFLYGNILPDISKKYGECPHYIKDALSYVVSSNEKLLSENNHSLYSYEFAKKLGVINHYLSDFFCHPHTEGYSKSKAHHGYYEFMMIARYRKGLRALSALLKEKNASISPRNLSVFILNHNKIYANNKASDVNDIRYALFAGLVMSEDILAQFLAAPVNSTLYEGIAKAQAI